MPPATQSDQKVTVEIGMRPMTIERIHWDAFLFYVGSCLHPGSRWEALPQCMGKLVLMGKLARTCLNHAPGNLNVDVDDISVEKDSGWREIDLTHVEDLLDGVIRKGLFGATVST